MKYLIVLYIFLSTSVLANEKLLVANKDGHDLSILDSQSGQVLHTIKTGTSPHEVAVTPNQSNAVVTNYGNGCGEDAGNSLTVVNLQDYSSFDIDLGQYRGPHGIQSFKDSKRVAVTVECSQALIIVDIVQKKIIQTINTESSVSHMVSLSKDEKMAFVANIGSGSVSILDLQKGTLVKNIKTGSGAEGIDITPDGLNLWISNRSDDSISVISIAKLEVIDTIKVAQMPIRIKIHPTKPLVLVSNARSATLAIINTENHQVLQQLSMTEKKISDNGDVFRNGPVPIGVVFSNDGKFAYVANTNVDEIRQIDLQNFKVTKMLKAGKRPDGLAVAY